MTRLILLLPIAVATALNDVSAADHWAYQPVRNPEIPGVKDQSWPTSPIDHFILARLESKNIVPSPKADRRTLIRRATYDLTGLPPTPQEIDDFVNDSGPGSFARVVDRLLDSPRYGERWGRYWLDVARYADTKGYIFTEERRFPYSHTYRDWVIRVLNEDLPYDQFLMQQIAADQLPLGDDKRSLAALGFLTLGRRFLGNMHDIIDDRIDVVTRGTMALTVQCARCHDHKYDPIPQTDYYSLYGVFASCTDKELPIAVATAEYEEELRKREGEQNEFLESTLSRTLHKLRTQVAEYLLAAESLKDHPDIQEFMFVDNPGDINRFALGRWRTYLELASKEQHPIFAPWFAWAALSEAEFAHKAAEVAGRIRNPANSPKINPLVAEAFAGEPPQSIREVADRYGKLFDAIESEWQRLVDDAKESGAAPPSRLADEAREELRQVLYAPDSPTAVPKRRVDDLFEKPDADKLRALRKKVQELRTSPQAPPNAMALVDNEKPVNPVVFVRGNPSNRGPTVPRQFLSIVAGEARQPFAQGSGRLELAQAIANPSNPLTARAIVNRAWLHHFGAGLVTTPSDFGTRSDPPSHPELLDWLAQSFIEGGWSLKRVHRIIMLSSAYQQSSDWVARAGSVDPSLVDPENRWLWRQRRQRLDFESMRDSLLAVAGDVDLTMGGASVDLSKQPFSRRRTVYGFIERQNLPGMFRTFDFASPDTHCPNRFTTTVPQQALFLMNSPFVVEQARRVAARGDVVSQNDPRLRVERLYRIVFGRPATGQEIELALEFVTRPQGSSESAALNPWEQYAQVLLLSNEFMFVD